MTRLALASVAAIALSFWFFSDDGMASCQIKHSFDTCFAQMNR